MKSLIAALGAVAAACHAGAAHPLHAYTYAVTYPIDVSEASGIAYNWDTDTLFVIGDEGYALVQITKRGLTIDQMGFDYFVSPRDARGLDDPEGVAYLGNNTFIIADERDFMGRATTYQAGAVRTQAELNPRSYDFDYQNLYETTNSGVEGIAFDPIDKAVWAIKESGPVSVYKMTGVPDIAGNAGSPVVVTEPIERRIISRWYSNPVASPLLIDQISDIFALSSCAAIPADDPRKMNLLLLSRDRHLIFEVTRTGTVVDTLSTDMIGRGTIEGMTMDNDGVLYLVSEQTGAPNNFPALHVLTTSPTPPQPFSVTSCVVEQSEEAARATISWNSTIGGQYVIEFCPSLAEGNWQPVTPTITAAAVTSKASTEPLANSGRGFYRVKEVTTP